MLNINYTKIEKKEFPNLQLNLVEPINKLNLSMEDHCGKNVWMLVKNLTLHHMAQKQCTY